MTAVMHRHTKWLHKKGRAYADARNEQTKAYQETRAGWLAMKTGRINSGAKMRGVCGKIGSLQLLELWAAQNGIDMLGPVKCACCRALSNEWHADHIVALSDGGEHSISNLQLVCEACHKAKTRHDRDAYTEQPLLFDGPSKETTETGAS